MKKFLTIFVVLLIVIGGLWFYWHYYYTYSDGNRTGLLQKFSHKGNIFKTYEGELVLSSIQSTAGVGLASEKFYFSVADDSLAVKMMNYEGHRVTLHYQQKNASISWRGDSEYIVDKMTAEP
jgi:hypothetical protein